MNWMVIQSLQQQLKANHQVPKGEIKDNYENGREYAGITQTRYQNLMLDRQILRTKERPTGHRSFLPQKVVMHEVWISGFQRRHNYKRRSPHKEM
jgi:hypothetical protein